MTIASASLRMTCGLWAKARRRALRHELSRLCRVTRTVVLTYDDGPSEALTPALLDQLRRHGARATFFPVGRSAEVRHQLLTRVVAEGHEVGCHSYAHLDPWGAMPWRVARDVDAGFAALHRFGARLFRPPYGRLTLASQRAARRHGAEIALWTVDSRDIQAAAMEPSELIAHLEAAAGGVVLMHDHHREWATAGRVLRLTEAVLRAAATEGWKVRTFSELLKARHPSSDSFPDVRVAA